MQRRRDGDGHHGLGRVSRYCWLGRLLRRGRLLRNRRHLGRERHQRIERQRRLGRLVGLGWNRGYGGFEWRRRNSWIGWDELV
jgi:hypothetical protein